jgi:hypothetical protein
MKGGKLEGKCAVGGFSKVGIAISGMPINCVCEYAVNTGTLAFQRPAAGTSHKRSSLWKAALS